MRKASNTCLQKYVIIKNSAKLELADGRPHILKTFEKSVRINNTPS